MRCNIVACLASIVALIALVSATSGTAKEQWGASRATWTDSGLGSGYTQEQTAAQVRTEISYSDFVRRIESNEIRSISIRGRRIVGEFSDGRAFSTTVPDDSGLIPRLIAHKVEITASRNLGMLEFDGASGRLLIVFVVLLLGGLMVFLVAITHDGGETSGTGHTGGMGQSRAKLLSECARRVTFRDVAGIEEAQTELEDIVAFLRNPAKFQQLGGKIPKGFLLAGPPGTGKTLLARAIAGEADVPFFSVSGSAFVEMFVGVGASRVRDMFAQARKNAPCIIFVDEIDAVGRKRSNGIGVGNEERDQTLNQLLVEMDGFEANEGIIVLAATNRPDMLDSALLRPGRFDRHVIVSNPDVLGRERILEIHLQKVPLAPDVDRMAIARRTPGFSGADLANLVNEAALLAARRGNSVVTMAEFEDAKDKILMGAERRSLVMTQEERRITAYHEAGHALVAFFTPGHDPLHKVTIVPRGRALGVTMSLPDRDRHCFNRQELEARLVMLLGGRMAEELAFGEEFVTTGAGDDIRQASNLARRMVTEFGFNTRLGPLYCGMTEQTFLLSRQVGRRDIHSDATATVIDEEIQKIIDKARTQARNILTRHIGQLDLVAKALVDHETLSGEQIRALLDNRPLEIDPLTAA